MSMPTIFVSHGSPTLILDDVPARAFLASLGQLLPKPQAIVAVSAHWDTDVPAVSLARKPETIHDFYNFPEPLYRLRYPAPGAPELAQRAQALLKNAGFGAAIDGVRGLDHGAWSPLLYAYPEADVPVVQLSIDETRAPAVHHELGVRLRALRDEGILILGSGDVVHNLHAYAWGGHPQEPYDWALRFEATVRARLQAGEHAPLVNYGAVGKDALLSVPTPEHYLPLLYVLGASFPGEPVTFPVQGMDGGSVSMLSVQIG